MPIYEYECPRCEEKFELLIRKIDEVNIHSGNCPKCGTLCDRVLSGEYSFTFSPFLQELREGNML